MKKEKVFTIDLASTQTCRPFLESPSNVSGPESRFVFTVFAFTNYF